MTLHHCSLIHSSNLGTGLWLSAAEEMVGEGGFKPLLHSTAPQGSWGHFGPWHKVEQPPDVKGHCVACSAAIHLCHWQAPYSIWVFQYAKEFPAVHLRKLCAARIM